MRYLLLLLCGFIFAQTTSFDDAEIEQYTVSTLTPADTVLIDFDEYPRQLITLSDDVTFSIVNPVNGGYIQLIVRGNKAPFADINWQQTNPLWMGDVTQRVPFEKTIMLELVAYGTATNFVLIRQVVSLPNDAWDTTDDHTIQSNYPIVTDLPVSYDAVAGDNYVTVFDSWLGTALADGDSIRHQYRINGANSFEYGATSDGTGGIDGQYFINNGVFANNGFVGVGTSAPSDDIEVNGAGNMIKLTNSDDGAALLYLGEVSDDAFIKLYANGAVKTVEILSDGDSYLSSGNVGIGNSSLEAWASAFTAIQVGGNSAIMGHTAQSGSGANYYMQNAYSDGSFKYISTGPTSKYRQGNGGHVLSVSGAGAADGTITFTDAFSIDSTAIISQAVTAGITASVTQTQGGGTVLTSNINEVSTVGTADDAVTMMTAVAGTRVIIMNNGANQLQIFPASGDDLGAGVNTAVSLSSGSNVEFVSYDVTNWEQI